MFAEKARFGVLCTCKATSLSKMTKLVWTYSDEAKATLVLKTYTSFKRSKTKRSGMTLSLNGV